MERFRIAFLTIALVALASFTLVACGDDEESETTTSGGAAATTTAADGADAPAGDPIKVGSIVSATGPLAGSLGRSADVLTAWEKHTNAAGGINGHPVKVTTIDDGQNPAKGLAAAKKLIEEEGVVAIVGQMSLVSASWEKYASDKGVPVVGGQPVDTPFMTNPNFFTSGSTLPALLYGEIELTAKAGKKKANVMYCAETPICAQLEPILAGIGKMAGVEVTGQKISSTAPNYNAPCLAAKGKGAEALFVAVNSSVVPRVMASCAKQGYKPLSVASSATTDKAWLDEPDLNGTVISATNAVYTDESVPGVKAFSEALDQYAPGLRDSKQFSFPLIYPWAGGELFAKAAEAAKLTPESKPADVVKGLYALENETLDGIAPPLNFVEGQPGFTPCYFPAEIADGEFRSTSDNEPVCLPEDKAKQLAAAIGG
ncbi:MAG: ABC transporter substrate-binding protein [Solirubrobacteraceae bacterium]|nr:ABC transporter substrate-binding protein [Solirubrobacteraceae bacterium]